METLTVARIFWSAFWTTVLLIVAPLSLAFWLYWKREGLRSKEYFSRGWRAAMRKIQGTK